MFYHTALGTWIGSAFEISASKRSGTSHKLQGIEHERGKDSMKSTERGVGARTSEDTTMPL